LFIERYLAAKFGTNFLISVWRVVFIERIVRDWSGFYFFFYFLVVVISQVLSSDSDDSFKNLP
jgi:hypothetical protein